MEIPQDSPVSDFHGNTLAKLIAQLRENNVTILLGVLVCYQIGIFDKVATYGAGMC